MSAGQYDEHGRPTKWHKGSRLWLIGALTIALAYSLVWLMVFKMPDRPEMVGQAMTTFMVLGATVLGSGGAHNVVQAAKGPPTGGAG